MDDNLKLILKAYGFPNDGNISFLKALKHIYYEFDMAMFQDFMNEILALETEKGEVIFDGD